MRGAIGGDEVKDSDMVMKSSRRIARDTLELSYSWDSDRIGKTEIVDDSISVY